MAHKKIPQAVKAPKAAKPLASLEMTKESGVINPAGLHFAPVTGKQRVTLKAMFLTRIPAAEYAVTRPVPGPATVITALKMGMPETVRVAVPASLFPRCRKN